MVNSLVDKADSFSGSLVNTGRNLSIQTVFTGKMVSQHLLHQVLYLYLRRESEKMVS